MTSVHALASVAGLLAALVPATLQAAPAQAGTVEVAEICGSGQDCGCPDEMLCGFGEVKGLAHGITRFTPTVVARRFTCPEGSNCPFAIVPDDFRLAPAP